MKRVGYTYILTNENNTTLYVGITADLVKRVEEHINKIHPNSFSAKYNLTKLVWFEGFNHIEDAITREKQLKAGSRKKKEQLINSNNPSWTDLYPKIISGEIEVQHWDCFVVRRRPPRNDEHWSPTRHCERFCNYC